MTDHQLHSQPRGARAARERHGEIQDLLNRLARGLTAGDGKAVAAEWGVPAIVIGADGVHAVSTRDEVAGFFTGAKQQYNDRGITDTRPEIRDEDWIGDGVVIVKVRWPYLDAQGKEVGAEASDYTLRRDDAGKLEVRCVIMRGVEPGTH